MLRAAAAQRVAIVLDCDCNNPAKILRFDELQGQDYIILLIWVWNKSDSRLQLGAQIEIVET